VFKKKKDTRNIPPRKVFGKKKKKKEKNAPVAKTMSTARGEKARNKQDTLAAYATGVLLQNYAKREMCDNGIVLGKGAYVNESCRKKGGRGAHMWGGGGPARCRSVCRVGAPSE